MAAGTAVGSRELSTGSRTRSLEISPMQRRSRTRALSAESLASASPARRTSARSRSTSVELQGEGRRVVSINAPPTTASRRSRSRVIAGAESSPSRRTPSPLDAFVWHRITSKGANPYVDATRATTGQYVWDRPSATKVDAAANTEPEEKLVVRQPTSWASRWLSAEQHHDIQTAEMEVQVLLGDMEEELKPTSHAKRRTSLGIGVPSDWSTTKQPKEAKEDVPVVMGRGAPGVPRPTTRDIAFSEQQEDAGEAMLASARARLEGLQKQVEAKRNAMDDVIRGMQVRFRKLSEQASTPSPQDGSSALLRRDSSVREPSLPKEATPPQPEMLAPASAVLGSLRRLPTDPFSQVRTPSRMMTGQV